MSTTSDACCCGGRIFNIYPKQVKPAMERYILRCFEKVLSELCLRLRRVMAINPEAEFSLL